PRITPQYPENLGPRRPRNLARGQSDVAGIPPAPRRKRVNLPDPEVGVLPALPTVPRRPIEEPQPDFFSEPLPTDTGLFATPQTVFRGQNGFDDEPGNFGADQPQGVLPPDPFFADDQPPDYIPIDV